MKVTMLLADAAQAVNGKLYILGGGWSVTGPAPSPSAIALKIEVPWDEANTRHKLTLDLVVRSCSCVITGSCLQNPIVALSPSVRSTGIQANNRNYTLRR